MHHLHVWGIAHRDIASRNFLLDENLNIKISDCKLVFRINTVVGLARTLPPHVTSGSENVAFGPIRWMVCALIN